MPLTNPNKIVTEERLSEFYQQILPYLGGSSHTLIGGAQPIGSIIPFMGTVVPSGTLACDGTVYNIADYPDLANFFDAQFGQINKFGGNGTTTFAVPDLRGEFLRGTGTNGHTNQGDGASVGVHQNGTLIPELNINNTTGQTNQLYMTARTNQNSSWSNEDYKDEVTCSAGVATAPRINFDTNNAFSDGIKRTIKATVRPTNTSILWCIQAVSENTYSTDEKIVGTWIDGSPVWQKTVSTGGSVPTGATLILRTAMASTGYDTILYII